MQKIVCFIFLSFSLLVSSAQIDPKKIDIVRDQWGVPHIFAKTDAEVAYGLAWAYAEDDFASLQTVALPTKNLMGRVLGKKGVAGDYAFALFRCMEITEERWHTLSPAFIKLAEGYVQGLNDYAKKHPEEVLHKKLFPLTVKEYVASSVLALTVFNGADRALQRIYANRAFTAPAIEEKGSNSVALHGNKTTTGENMLVINAHQPNTGSQAFYEAHINSEEGINALGGLLAGGPCILHGVNEQLGWAHTVNLADRLDVYQLKINPNNKNQYEFDGQWVDLETKRIKLRIKGIPIAVGRTIYWSKYGATVKNKQGLFAIRLGANMRIGALQQWYEMNKAKNFTQFYQALSKQELSMFNIMYADKHDTIFYINNALMPIRDGSLAFNWRRTLPGNTSKTLWTDFRKIQELPQYINPKSGYLFNTNHSSFLATATTDNLKYNSFPKQDGWETDNNNRSARFMEMMPAAKKISLEELKQIKFNLQLPKKLRYLYDIDSMLLVDAKEHPQYATLIENFKNWDKNGNANSKGAAIFLLTYLNTVKMMDGQDARPLTMAESLQNYQYILDYMTKNFGRVDLTLGDIQKLVRGDKEWPLGGFPDLLAPQWTAPYKDGKLKSIGGDGYIVFAQFPKNGLPVLETINMYGASARKGDKHFDDQVEMYLKQQTKKMTLDKKEIYKNAERIYHPE